MSPEHAEAEPREAVDLRVLIEARSEASGPDALRVRRLVRLGVIGSTVVLALGFAVSAAWFLGLDLVTTVLPGLASMKLSTSASLVGLGTALLLVGRPDARGVRLTTLAIAASGALLALVTLVGYAVGAGWGSLDFLLIVGADQGGAAGDGRMSQATALGLLLLWAALIACVLERVGLAQGLATLALALGTITSLGYAYDVRSLYAVGPFSSTALHTSLAILVASVSLLGLRSGQGFLALLTGSSAGGVVVRRLLPVAVLVPMLAGGLIVRGEAAGLYDGPLGLALLATSVALAGAALTWWQAARLRHIDIRRAGAEEALALAQQAIEARDRMADDLRDAERRRRRVIESSAEAYVSFDRKGRVADWNDAASRLFGWERAEALGESLLDLLVPAGDRGQARLLLARLRDGRDEGLLNVTREVPLVDRAGRSRLVELLVWSPDDADDEHRSFHSFLSDVTDRRATFEDLRRSHSDLQDFSAAMAHDLRMPLTVIRGLTHLLRESVATDPELEGTGFAATGGTWLERMDGATDRGLSLIDDILAFARLRDREPLHVEVDLTELIGDVVEEQLAATGRPARVQLGSCGHIHADRALLRQLFSNVIGNALKYVPEDRSPEVLVAAERDARSRGLRVTVADNGDGIRAVDRERIFGMFERGSGVRTASGTGVGLAISQRVAELHHGHVALDPESGGGTCFEIVLGTALIEAPDPDAPPRLFTSAAGQSPA